jgi:hypothetical protein
MILTLAPTLSCPEADRCFVVSMNRGKWVLLSIPLKEARKMNTQLQATMIGRDLPGHSAVKPCRRVGVSAYPPTPRLRRTGRRGSSNRSGNDLSAFGITLTFIFGLATAAAHSNHPLLWLIVGPLAIVLLFFIASLLRVCLPHISAKRSHPRSGRARVSSEKSLIRMGYAKLAPEC